MRKLFVMMLTSNCLIRPEVVWEAVWDYFSEDAQRNRRFQIELVLTDEEKKNYALIQIEELLQVCSKSLKDYPDMPTPDTDNDRLTDNRLLYEELSYDREALQQEHDILVTKLTDEQKTVYDAVISAVELNTGGLFFVYGYGGTGKTFVWSTLSSALRSKGEVVLNVASSGIASLLLPGGRTTHSRFAIPISLNEDSTYNIKQGSHLAELIVKCKLIIWDEAPMLHKHCFEALDRTMRDLLRFSNLQMSNKPFGGKTVVLGGDFRQILPVLPKGTRQDTVGSSINSSYLWQSCKVLRLTKNLRLRSMNSRGDIVELENFAKWISAIGDGTIGVKRDKNFELEIPPNILLKSSGDPIAIIVDSTFPMFRSAHGDCSYLNDRAILAPTLEVVDRINEYMSGMNTAEGRTYLSCDSIEKSDSNVDTISDLHTPEFLNSLRCSGVPNHALTLKVGSSVMLLRNIDHSIGLCNGTRLIITRLADHVLEAKVMSGDHAGTKVLIPRMSLTPSDPRLPFKFQRRQFPLMLSYAMTINKSQGQTLSHVGLFLKKPVFNNGQLYVAVSRVSNPSGLKILICNDIDKNCSSTTNVVYKEVFNNL